MSQHSQRVHLAIKTARQGMIINTFLVVLKVLAGIIGNSYALIADGIESGADVFSSLIVWKGLHVSKRDADEEYHFGYGKAETLSGAIVSLMLIGASLAVFILSIREIITPHHLPAKFTLFILIFVFIVKYLLSKRVMKISDDVQSSALKGDAWHHRSDAITSLAAFIGISIAIIGGPGWEPADDYAALLCAFIIGWNGLHLLRSSIHELMDRAPDDEILKSVTDAAASVPGVRMVEKVLARKSGLSFFVAMHVHADPEISLKAAHILSGMVKTAVKKAVPHIHDVLVHMEPDEGER